MRLLALSVALVSSLASAQVSGMLGTGTTTWAGNVSMVGDVTVPVGGTLLIQPGTVVTAAATDSQGSGDLATKPEIIVLGTLNVAGVNGGGVVFTSSTAGTTAWGGVVIRAGGSATIGFLTMDKAQNGITVFTGAAGVTTTLNLSDSTLKDSANGLWVGSGAGATNVSLTNTQLLNNQSRGLEVAGGTVTLTSSTVSGTTGSYGLYQTGGTVSATSSLLVNNTYNGAYLVGGTASFDRCTISGNGTVSITASGVETSVASGTTTIVSSIISHNSGRGVQRSSSGTISLTNSNVWGNSRSWGAPPTSSANLDSANVSGTSSVVWGNASNNKSENPLFVDFVGKNYRLTSNSGSRFSGVSNADQGALPYVADATVGVQGTYWTSTTLSGAVSVIGDVTVPPGVTLQLAAGSTLTFATTDAVGGGVGAQRAELLVRGTLTAVGTSGSPITLTGAGSGTTAWGGLTVRASGSVNLANVAMDESTDGITVEPGSAATSFTMSNSTLQNSGNGLYVSNNPGAATVSLSQVQLLNNQSRGLEVAGGTVTMATSLIKGTSGSYGVYQTGGTFSATSTAIVNNAYNGAYLVGGTASFDRCTISGNGTVSITAPGVETSVASGTTTIVSSIISHNSGRGVQRSSSGTINLTYSNVWGNSRSWGPPPTASANLDSANISGTNSVVVGNTSNNKSENPLFVDFATQNYSLQVGSPSRGAGSAGVDQGAYPYSVGAVTTVTISPTTATVAAGGVVGFAAIARDAMGNIVQNEPFTWAVSPGAGAISTSGVLTAGCTPGTYTAAVTARSPNGTTGSASVIINLGTPSQIAITPNNAQVKSQATQQYSASVKDSCGNTLTGQAITWSANALSGSITSGGLFTASCLRGIYAGGVTASSGSLIQSTQVEVIAGDPAAVAVTPMTVNVPAGTTQQFAASVADGCGNTVTSAVTWSTDATGSTVSGTGLFTAGQANGPFTVTATSGAKMGTASVIVTGGSGGTGGTVASVDVAPLTATLSPGGTQTFTATARDSGGNVLTGQPVIWAASSGGAITQGGVFTAGTTAGTFTDVVSATIGGVTGRASVTVTAGAVTSVTVTPSTVTLAPGGQATFTATAKDAFMNVVPSTIVWSATTSVGTITQGGVLTVTSSPGTYSASVTASVGGVSGTASVTVMNGALSMLSVAPAAAQLQAGGSVAFTATGRDAMGNVVAVSPIWSVVAMGGTINSSGVFAAGTASGTFPNTVKAEANGLTAFASVSVTPGPVLSVAVSPMTATVQAGGSAQFTAEARDAFNNVVPTAFTWTANSAAGTITQGGFFTAGASPGSYPNAITAAAGSINGLASVSIMPGGATGGGGGGTGGGGGATGGGTGTGGGSATGGGSMAMGGGEGTGGGGGGGGAMPTGCSCNTVDAASVMALGLLGLLRRRRPH